MSTELGLLLRQECGLARQQVITRSLWTGSGFVNVCLPWQTLRVARSCRKQRAGSLAKPIPPHHTSEHPRRPASACGGARGWGAWLRGQRTRWGVFWYSVFCNTLLGVNQHRSQVNYHNPHCLRIGSRACPWHCRPHCQASSTPAPSPRHICAPAAATAHAAALPRLPRQLLATPEGGPVILGANSPCWVNKCTWCGAMCRASPLHRTGFFHGPG